MVAILQLAIEIFYRDQHVKEYRVGRIPDDVLADLGLRDDALPGSSMKCSRAFHGQA